MKAPQSGLEVESKFELSEEDFHRLRDDGEVVECQEQLNVYYDAEGQLANSAITFRVRVIPGGTPRMTLKIPMECRGGTRHAIEIEAECARWIPSRFLSVNADLPHELSAPLCERGIHSVQRLGSMRTTRWVVALADDLEIELDRVDLPGGRVFFEAEVEEAEAEKRQRTVEQLRLRVSAAKPSSVSKFERFVSSLRLIEEKVAAL